eukprot:scaffold1000_cov134-Pinguiococcus_pyrenoidosus.AAC.2
MLWRANDAASLSTERGTATGAAAESAEPRGPRLSGGRCEGCGIGNQGRFGVGCAPMRGAIRACEDLLRYGKGGIG